jgi:thiamine pyrophosphokinase
MPAEESHLENLYLSRKASQPIVGSIMALHVRNKSSSGTCIIWKEVFILRAVIFANGNLNRPVTLLPGDFIIAVDGGATHCLELGLRPAVVIGDLDSLTQPDLEALKIQGAKIIQYPVRKNFTDLELALSHARSLEVEEILILGALGARWEQTLANVLLSAAYPGLNIHLVDGNQELFYLRAGKTLTISGCPGDTLSLIPLGGDAKGITTDNLEYPLTGDRLPLGSTRGISNVMLENEAHISLREGLLLCVVIHQPKEVPK